MKNKYFLSLAILAISLLSFKTNAQSEKEDAPKDTRVNITITRDGETRSIEIDPDNMENLKDVMDQVVELEEIELDNKDGNIEVIVRSGKGEKGFKRLELSKDVNVFFDQKLHMEPRTFLGVVGHHQDKGIHLERVISETGAEEAGLKAGDVILEMDGVQLDSYKVFTDAIKAKNPGDQVKLKIERDGQLQSLSATLGESKNHVMEWTGKDLSSDMSFFLDKFEERFKANSDKGFLGVHFSMEGNEGVKINKVIEESPAAKAGLKEEDVILSIDGTPTTDGQAFLEVMSATQKDQVIELELNRKGEKINQKVTLGEKSDPFFKKVYLNHSNSGNHNFFGDKDVELRIEIRVEEVSGEERKMVNKALGLRSSEEFQDVDIEVYPNPGSGKYTIDVKIPETESLELLVLDQTGKEVFSRKLKNTAGSFKSDIDISDKAKGLYFLVLKSGKRTQVEKLIKE